MSRRMNGQPECPKCGKSGVSKVKNTYFTDKQEILRHRKCECGWGFWSYQELEMVLDPVQYQIKMPKWKTESGAKKKIELVPLK